MTKPVVCLDIGGSFIKSGVSLRAGSVDLLERLPMPVDDWPAFQFAIKALLLRHRHAIDTDSPLALSTAGLVSPDNGEVFASNIPAFHYRCVASELEQLLQRPVCIANDADCFALAESVAGMGKGQRTVFGAILGSGVGGGLVIDGNIISGAGGLCGEWGHGPITRTELSIGDEYRHIPRLTCACGQTGCLDTYGGARGLERLHLQLHHIALSSQQIVSNWHAKEKSARLTLQAWCELVSEPLGWLINLTGATRIVVGGGLASERALIALLDARVKQLILRKADAPLVVPGCFTENGGMMGASVLGHRLLT